ncbi:involucrin-like [Procambarus clarkii]|uniref:involucrin-like n=1 Tax=Procambarus clarkii TaxID=6728 RepID=UPI003742C845
MASQYNMDDQYNMASQYNMDDQYNMEDIHSALNAVLPETAEQNYISGLDAIASFDLDMVVAYLDSLSDMSSNHLGDGEGATSGHSGVDGPPEAPLSASGWDPQDHLGREGPASGWDPQDHLGREGPASGWDPQDHLGREGPASGWDPQDHLGREGPASGWDPQDHLGREGPASGWDPQDHLGREGPASGWDPQDHLGREGSTSGWDPQDHLGREGSASGWDPQDHLGHEGPASGWDPQDHLGREGPASSRKTSDHVGLRVVPCSAREDSGECFMMVDPNQVLAQNRTPSPPSALYDLSHLLTDECSQYLSEDISREQHSVYPQESEHRAHPAGALSGATESPYSSNLPAGTPPLRSSSSALEAVLGTRPATRKGYHHRVTRKYLPDGEEKEKRRKKLNNVASKDYRENKKMTLKMVEQLLEAEEKRQQQLTAKQQSLKLQVQRFREMYKVYFGETVPFT